MKFLIVAGSPKSLIGFRKDFIKALISKGLTIHVAAPSLLTEKNITKELSSLGVIPHNIIMQRTGINPWNDFKSLLSIWCLNRKVKPDYIMGYTIKPVIYGSLAAWFAGVPKRNALITGLGYAFQSGDSNKRNLVKKVAYWLYKISLSKCETIFFQNPDDERLFRTLGILTENSHTVVVNGSGINLELYPFTTIIFHKHPKFLFIGRLLGDKGVRDYAEAARLVKLKYPKVVFNLIGRIDINPDAISQNELNKWVSEGSVNYYGELHDVKPQITESSVFVLPSYREGTPRAVLEAMSMGRAIITTDAPGCRETVVDGENGFLVPISSPEALACAMIRFIEKPELIIEMGRKSREIAELKYDVHKVNKKMLERMGL